MTTTLLPKEQVDVLRSIGDAANVLVALLLIDRLYPGRSTRPDELSMLLDKDRRSVERRLVSLCASDRVCFDGRGYVLLEGGRALLLASTPSLESRTGTPEMVTESDDFDQALALSPATEEAQAPQDQAPTEVITLEATDPEPGGTHAMRALLEEEEDIHLNPIDKNTSSSDSNAQSVQTKPVLKPTTLEILDATELLFEKTMTTAGIENKPRRMVIGWVAQAWDQRRHLRSPQGLIYARLSANAQPQQKYYDHPRDYLPENYLVRLGLAQPKPQVVEPDSEPEPDEGSVTPELDTDDSVNEPVSGSRLTPAQAWQSVLGQLQMEMHRAPFDTWVRDTKPVRFHQNKLFVGAGNSYTCGWLTDRLKSTVERLLVGILNQSVEVEFVVSYRKAED